MLYYGRNNLEPGVMDGHLEKAGSDRFILDPFFMDFKAQSHLRAGNFLSLRV